MSASTLSGVGFDKEELQLLEEIKKLILKANNCLGKEAALEKYEKFRNIALDVREGRFRKEILRLKHNNLIASRSKGLFQNLTFLECSAVEIENKQIVIRKLPLACHQ
jgi:hypothetical protein